MAEYKIQSGLPAYPAGLPDKEANLVVPLYRALNTLAQNISIATGNVAFSSGEMAGLSQLVGLTDSKVSTINVQAAEDLTFGHLLSLSIAGDKIVAHKADATVLTKPALAACTAPQGIAAGAYGTAVFMRGRVEGISGTVFGATYYLGTAGLVQLPAPVATGVLNQIVGIGLGTAGFYLNIEPVAKRPVLVYLYAAGTLRVLYSDGSHEDLAV